MELLPKSAYETPVPELYPVRQTFDPAHVEDIEAAVRAEFARPEIARRVRPGVKTALLAGSRGIAKTGEIVNIDGTGNRLAGTLFGHKKLYLIVGKNKIADDLDGAIWRAR
ncbi:MAG: LUD domain-containing protein, partial [Firmicutes bacterium]|nr:LUD domain-containing protein [Bacillota bacterium]